MRKYFLVLGLTFILVLGLTFSGMTQDLTGEEVLDKVEESIDAETSQIEFKMELYSEGGNVRERELEVYSKEGETEKALIRFVAPPSVEGTGFLNLNEDGEEDMYLFMPAVGSVRRIASGQKSGSFVGTDFSYNDLSVLGGGNFQEDYNSSIIEETEKEYTLKIEPTQADIEYSYGEMTIQKNHWYPVKIKFYDEKEKLYKILTSEDIVQKDDYWVAEKMTMANEQEGTKTVLYLNEITYDETIEDKIFTTRYLERY